MPTYLSSTMSRAKSSVRPASVIAAPPILITTVLPWNSRMYGSASRRVPTSLTADSSCRVLRVDGHVVVREVGEVDLGLAALTGDRERVLDLVAAHGRCEIAELGGGDVVPLPRGHHAPALDLEVDDERRRQHGAGGLEDAAEVGIGAVKGGLDERRVGDGTGHGLDLVRVAADDHATDPLRTLAVGHDLHRKLAHQRVHPLAQQNLAGRLRLRRDARRVTRHHELRVARRELA